MGHDTSFIKNYCTEVEFELNEQNLQSFGYTNISSDEKLSQHSQAVTIYQNVHSQKTYELHNLEILPKQEKNTIKCLQKLYYGSFQHLTKIERFSVCQTMYTFLKGSSKQLKLLIEETPLELKYQIPKTFENLSNTEICELLAAFVHVIQQLAVLDCKSNLLIDPDRFYKSDSQKIKYKPHFLEEDVQHLFTNSYYGPQIITWKIGGQIDFERSLIFSIGMTILHFFIGESCFDCYYARESQFCWSELEKKMDYFSNLVQSRSCIRALSRNSSVRKVQKDCFQECFEAVVYKIVSGMLRSMQNRLSLPELKSIVHELILKATQSIVSESQCSEFTSSQSFLANKLSPSIHSTDDNSSCRPIEKFQFKEVRIQTDQSSYFHSSEEEDKKFPYIPRKSNRARKPLVDKENCLDIDNSFQKFHNGLKGLNRVSVPHQDTEIVSSYFVGTKSEGLGKLVKVSGEIEQCIFDNDVMIEPIQRV